MYTISRVDNTRMIECPKRDLERYFFYTDDRQKVKWDNNLSDTSNARVIVNSEVYIFKKPHPSHFHYEYMRNERLKLNGWGGVEHDALLENMLELLEKI